MADSRTDRVERVARNQALFREVNEQLEALAGAFQFVAAQPVFVCECADVECIEQIDMTMAEYEALREHPERFAILVRHEVPDVEDVVERRDGYLIVEKIAEASAIVAEADPRARGD